MRRLSAAAALACLCSAASAQPIIEGSQRELTGVLLGGDAGVQVMLVAVTGRYGDRSPFQSFAEFDIGETDYRLTALTPGLDPVSPRAPIDAVVDIAVLPGLGDTPSFDTPDPEDGRLGPALDPTTLVIGEPGTLGPDVGLAALSEEGDGSLPPIGLQTAEEADEPLANPVPGAVWLLGTALVGLSLARRRRV